MSDLPGSLAKVNGLNAIIALQQPWPMYSMSVCMAGQSPEMPGRHWLGLNAHIAQINERERCFWTF